MTQIATMAAQVLPPSPDGTDAVPEWVHLLPEGDEVRTHDGRGPYRVPDADALIAASMQAGSLPIDENHATDLAAPKGGQSPARGWIVELQSRAGGLWGRVEWTRRGRELLGDREYRGISPVFTHDKAGRVLRLLRASLTNTPNLRGLTALHAEEADMSMERIAEALGLAATATADEAVAKIEELTAAPALQSALGAIGTALGVEADEASIVAAAAVAKAGVEQVTALQSQVDTLNGQLEGLRSERVREASAAYVDAEMAKGRAGLNASTRDTLIALHMSQPDSAVTIIGAMPVIGPGAEAPKRAVEAKAGETLSLNAEQLAAANALGIAVGDYLKTLQAEGA